MTKPLTAAVRIVMSLVYLGILIQSSGAGAQTAAEAEWVPKADLTAAQLATLPWYCNGLYVQPRLSNQQISTAGAARVSAKTALHVIDQSTTFDGDVSITQGDRHIHAPSAVMDDLSQNVMLNGPVTIREANLLMTGDHAEGNLFTGTGVIDRATFLLHQSRIRGSAALLEKKDNNELQIHDGDFTRCEPESNMWSIHGSKIRLLTEEGYGTARNVTVKVKNIPVAYFPYFRFPINDERQSGFLMPGIAHDSESGLDLMLPYYFNLAPDYDATYTFRTLWERGLHHDGEFRYLTSNSTNFINAAYIHNDQLYDDRTDFDLSNGNTIPAFEKQDRWFLNTTHSGRWFNNVKSSINYSVVSDKDYLSDFGGSVGSASGNSYTNDFDTAIGNNKSVPALDRTGSLSYFKGNFSSQLTVQSFQNLNEFSLEQYKKLPELMLNYWHNFNTFNISSRLQYTYFDKKNQDVIGPLASIGERTVIDLTLDAPLRNRWGYIIPAVGLIHRSYNLQDQPVFARSNPELTTPSFSLDTGLIFDRFFTVFKQNIQQTLEPRLFYLYTEYDAQDDLPRFDAGAATPSYSRLFRKNRFSGYDRIGDAEQLTIGLSSSFLNVDTGAEIMRASLGQIQYFADRQVSFNPGLGNDPTASASALFTELRASLGPKFTIHSAYEWEPRENRSNRGNFSLKFNPDERKIINLTYTYTSPEVQLLGQFQNTEESDVSFIWPVLGKWSAIGRWNYGWDDAQTVESLYGVEYNDCCWKFRLVYRRYLEEPRLISVTIDDPSSPSGITQINTLDHRVDSGIFLEFQLKGLASLGGRLDRLLEDAIPNYRARENQIGL